METNETTAANDFKGTIFDTGFNSSTSPVKIGAVNIEGVVLHVAVYPQRRSRRGTLVNDVRLHYPPRESGRLVRVDE